MIKIRELINQDAWVRVTYRNTKQRYHDWRECRFLRVPLTNCPHFNCEPTSSFLLMTVAYNRADMIRHQVRLLPKYLTDPFHHIIVDNSSDPQQRDAIAIICREHSIGYVALPYNYQRGPSASHGMAMNWAARHLISSINPTYVGWLDHDIFPVRRHSIVALLEEQGLYGRKEQREDINYLWPGFSFYRSAWLDHATADFKPGVMNGVMVDTGGQVPLVSMLNTNELSWPESHYTPIRDGINARKRIEWLIMDRKRTWLHGIGAGHGTRSNAKEQTLVALLEQY